MEEGTDVRGAVYAVYGQKLDRSHVYVTVRIMSSM